MHNKPLVPTRKGEAPLLAAQRQRSMWKEELEREYRSLVADKEATVVPVLLFDSRRRGEVNSASGMIKEETMNRSCAIHPSGSLVTRTALSGAASSLSVVAASNNALEPTPVTEARFVWCGSGAAQLCR